ncbi:hypothetical protein [Oscillospiraceae bacterium]|nr:hypothetical protein [Oscillospiraceae bacterium]
MSKNSRQSACFDGRGGATECMSFVACGEAKDMKFAPTR